MSKRIAIIGYSFRLPSTDKEHLWQDLLHGRNLITEVEHQRWSMEAFLHPDKNHPGTSYTFKAGSVGDVSLFDASFFGISPREAALMDPQQRLLLELAWEACENSGIKPSALRGSRCGVYIGISAVDYAYRMADDLSMLDSSAATGNTSSIAANRISYFFDLHGPSMAIDTACSSSLVAFHQACSSILSGETVQAITGGISLHLHPYGFITFSKASMLSRRGVCNVFDASGDGYVRSEGGGLFFLKEYDTAVADGDRILAVVAASAVNTDGRKSGLTVPSASAQADLLHQAYAQAGINPDDIAYVEAHGTGTAVGDPIETRALGEALGQLRSSDRPLPVGSIKSNLGHLEPAAGVAGLIKALLCIQHRTIPSTAGIKELNPAIPFKELNIEVVTENRPLKGKGDIIIGVNSFGFGGANAHVIVKSVRAETKTAQTPHLVSPLPLLISAKDARALKASARDFAAYLRTHATTSLYDIAHHSLFQRDWHEQRALVFGSSHAEIADVLQAYADESAPEQLETNTHLEAPSGPAFIYSGNGSQWFGMGKALLADPLFRETISEIDMLFGRLAGWSIAEELRCADGIDRYEFTERAQPTLFAIQVGITRMMRQRGIVPVAVAGHSVGEIAAAWACGALTLEDAVQVIYHRSQLQGTTKGKGQMTAVGLGESEAQQLLQEAWGGSVLTLAGSNSSRGVTVAGKPKHLERLETVLAQRGIFHKRLALDYAFHSPAMDPLEAGIRSTLAGITPSASVIPYYSTVTGGLLGGEGLGAEYWWHNIRKPVQFQQAVGAIISNGVNVLVEIGPSAILRGYINDCLHDAGITGRVITTGTRSDDRPQRVWGAVSQTVMAGVAIDWKQLFPSRGSFVELPNYPWQRERHWHVTTPESLGLLGRAMVHPLLGYRLPQHSLTWENQLDTSLFPALADHVVGDATLFPGSGFAELAVAAAGIWIEDGLVEIEELEINAPLVLSKTRSKSIRTAIDSSDGSFTITGRDFAGTDPWELHARGRILKGSRPDAPHQEALSLPSRQADFTGQSHHLLTTAAGLAYGPAFQAIGHGWIDGSTVTAVFSPSAAIAAELEQYHLHPALLDCSFQLIIQFLRDRLTSNEGTVFVPVRIGGLRLYDRHAQPHAACATLRRHSPHSLTADFSIFSAAGSLIATVTEARFRAVRLGGGHAGKHLDFLEYRAIPAPHPLDRPVASAIPFERFRQEIGEIVRRSVVKGVYRRYSEEVDPLLDVLCSRFTLEALQSIAGGSPVLTDEALQRLRGAHPDLALYLDHLLAMSLGDGTLTKTASGYTLSLDQHVQTSALDIWNSLFNDYPDYFRIIHSVARVGLHLHALLAGGGAQGYLPPPSSLAPLTQNVLGESGRMKLALAVRKILSGTLEQLPEGLRLGVTEISDGVPAFAATVCQALDFDRSDYRFVTTNAESAEESRRLLDRFPAMDIRLLDAPAVEVASVEEAGRRHDLMIVTCDFATISAASAALRYAWLNLAPGGLVLFVGQHPSRWVDFVYGSRPEWWFTPASGDSVSRQQPAVFWQKRMEHCGFNSIERMEFLPDTASGPYLLLARRSAAMDTPEHAPIIAAERTWLVVAESQGYPAQLAKLLEARLGERGERTVHLAPCSAAEISAELKRINTSYGGLRGIIHLAGLNSIQSDSTPDAYLAAQAGRCSSAAAIVKGCETTHTSATCWLVTAGAAVHLLPKRPHLPRPAGLAGIADAAVWGFGRTLMNETADNALRMVDLEDPDNLELVATRLAQELEQQDLEQEILITAGGERFAPRLNLVARPVVPVDEAEAAADSITRLGFQLPGQLRNLRWESHPVQPLEADTLEIEVHATGLNFRDFMYTLGLLSDEAVENGFAGPTLGLEFAGTVLRCGSDHTGFAAGDMVVGFGPASFCNRVITKAAAVSPIPPGLSFEAAATIPAAFFTAYYAMHYLARLQEGERVLIHGAAGGVGIAAIQVARWCGAEIHATAGTDEKRDFLRLLGVDNIYDSRSLTFADDILLRTGGSGVDVILNSLSGEAINRNLRVLRPFGRFLELGKRDFYENTRIGLRPFRNNISYFGIDADQLMSERPDLTRRLFQQIIALFNEGIFNPLPYHSFEADEVIDAFRYMQQSRQIGKIVVTYRNGISTVHRTGTPTPAALHLPAESTFLVTGGLSGFGLRTAEWLAGKGTRNLVLISRSGPVAEEAIQAIARLEAAGVAVHAAACDVTDRAALAALLDEAAQNMPPLTGIVHAAMVIDDSLIGSMTEEQIKRVLAPKVLGALHLHDLTSAMPLRHFVIFSSGTTLFGNPGQGNYVAANSWLEALAALRQAAGLPVTCVGWGAIDDVGFLARNEQIKEALQGRMGGSALNSAEALDALEAMMLAGSSGLGVLELDWRALSRFLPRAGSAKFNELSRLAGDGAAREEGEVDIQRLLTELSDTELHAAMVDMLRHEVGEVLRVSADKIDADKSLYEMGLDSLMGVELAVAVEALFGVKLPVMALSDSPTVSKLASRLILQLRGSAETGAPSPAAEILGQVQQVVAQHGAEVTSDAVERFAEDLQSGATAPSGRMIR